MLLWVCTSCGCYIFYLVDAQNIQLYGFGVIFNGLGLAGACCVVACGFQVYSASFHDTSTGLQMSRTMLGPLLSARAWLPQCQAHSPAAGGWRT